MYLIKKLEWTEDELNDNYYIAKGFYVFTFDLWQKPNEDRWSLYMDHGVHYFETSEDAKTAAQEHYENEIKKHLVLQSLDVREKP